ncbi:MAG: glycine cleavage system aminomethyltransferase GcvT [Chloroflexi bacterium]|nr:glycine cleavage system aminomethyltransferase GcvT [Chloroflexota bacterium]
MEAKRTPLYQSHLDLGARVIDFGGWAMPVQYSGILNEHRAVREVAGVFDVSHMGEFRVKGADAERFLNWVTTNDVSRLQIGQAQYSLLCQADGGVVDDVIVYRVADDEYLVVVNASNIEKDFAWLETNRSGAVDLRDESNETALVSIQGPLAAATLQPLVDVDLKQIKRFRHQQATMAGVPVRLARTGYTGEDGFEIFAPAADAQKIWDTLLAAPAGPGGAKVEPCGLGARDTLRTEAALPLYGHEIDATTNPLEAGLDRFVRLDGPSFLAKAALERVQAEGPRRRLVGLELLDRGVARAGHPIAVDDHPIGSVTSGTFAPTLNRNIALGYVESEHASVGEEVSVIVRDKPVRARIVELPFYRRGR